MTSKDATGATIVSGGGQRAAGWSSGNWEQEQEQGPADCVDLASRVQRVPTQGAKVRPPLLLLHPQPTGTG
jgi:hypothetical protein